MSITITTGGITMTGGGVSFIAAPTPPSTPTAGWYSGGYLTPAALTYSTVDRITYATDTATASVRGPLSLAKFKFASAGTTTYGWLGGGFNTITYETFSSVDRITYATDTATASVRGPLTQAVRQEAATGNTTDGWFGGGTTGSTRSSVDRITYATDTATATVRGPLSAAKRVLAATSNTTDGWFGGGYGPGSEDFSTVDRITYATDTATATVRGPLSAAMKYLAATGNATDGWFGGGSPATSLINRITYATDTTTASVRGPLSLARGTLAASGNETAGWFGGGRAFSGSFTDYSTVDRITYATDTTTASVRGPLSLARDGLSGTSGVQ